MISSFQSRCFFGGLGGHSYNQALKLDDHHLPYYSPPAPFCFPQRDLLGIQRLLNTSEFHLHQLTALLDCRGLHKVRCFVFWHFRHDYSEALQMPPFDLTSQSGAHESIFGLGEGFPKMFDQNRSVDVCELCTEANAAPSVVVLKRSFAAFFVCVDEI